VPAGTTLLACSFTTNRDLRYQIDLFTSLGMTVPGSGTPLLVDSVGGVGSASVTLPTAPGTYSLRVQPEDIGQGSAHVIDLVVGGSHTPTRIVSFRGQQAGSLTVNFFATFAGGNGTYSYFVRPDLNSPTLLPGGQTTSTLEVAVGTHTYATAGTYSARLSVSAGDPIPLEQAISVAVT
jgi:hypothetical protein